MMGHCIRVIGIIIKIIKIILKLSRLSLLIWNYEFSHQCPSSVRYDCGFIVQVAHNRLHHEDVSITYHERMGELWSNNTMHPYIDVSGIE